MRTNIVLDDELVREVQRITGATTKREAIDVALRQVVDRERQRGILAMCGRVAWDGDLDESRAGRHG